jgi:hypothetical protein
VSSPTSQTSFGGKDQRLRHRDGPFADLLAVNVERHLAAFAKRSCQRQTQVLDLPVSRTIAFEPTPSALSSTIRARQACFCRALVFQEKPEARKRNARAQSADSHAPIPRGIPNRIQM